MIYKAWSSIEEVSYWCQGHPSNFKVTQDRRSPILTQIEHFWTVTAVEFTNGFDMMHKAWCSTEDVLCCFSRSSIKFEGHMDQKTDDFNPILSKITRLVAAIKSLRFALLDIYMFMSSIIIPFYHKINLRSQRTSNAESISMAWCHHVLSLGKKALDRGQIWPTPFPQQNKFDWKLFNVIP